MVVADMDIVETCHQQLSKLRQCFFERPDGVKLASDELPRIIGDLRTYTSYDGNNQSKRVLGQALHLSSILSCYRMDYGACLRALNEMIDYARDLSDADMEAAALIQQGLLYYYEFRPSLRRSTFFRATQLMEKIQSPLIRERVFLGYVENMSVTEFIQKVKATPDLLFFFNTSADKNSITSKLEELLSKAAVPGQADRVVEWYLDMAESLFVSGDDPGYAYIRENSVTRATHRARFFVTRGMPSKAVELLTGIYNRDATPDNVEVLSLLAQAYSHMVLRREEDSFERVCFFVEALVDVSRRMESQLHHSQAQISYEFLMLSKWHREFSERLSHVVAF